MHTGLTRCLALALSVGLSFSPGIQAAESHGPDFHTHRAVSPALWGTSGILNVPSADTLRQGTLAASLRYFPLNSGLSGSTLFSPLENLELGLVFGAPPAQGFAAMAGTLKYRLIAQDQGLPVSLAVGATLLGLDAPQSYVPGNHFFLSLSHALHLPLDKHNLHLAHLHGGFMGDLKGARLVGGIEVPILDYGRIKVEYLGSLQDMSSQALNLGISLTPWPFLGIEAGLMQMPGRTFWDRDFVLGLTWSGHWGPQPVKATPSPVPSPSPSPEPSPTPQPMHSEPPPSTVEVQPQALKKGSFRIRVIDRLSQTALAGAELRLSSPDLKLRLKASTDLIGEANYLHVPVGAYEAEIIKEGWYSESRFISVQENRETFIEIALSQRTGRISGKVVYPDGNPVTDQAASLELSDSRGAVIKQVIPAANGTYQLNELIPGKYTLTLMYQGQIVSRKEVEIVPGAVLLQEFSVALPVTATPEPTATATPQPTSTATPSPVVSAPSKQNVAAIIEGQVKETGGAPLAGVRLKLENDDFMVITLTSPEGQYAFREIPAGVYRLSLNKQGYQTRVFQITITRTETLKHNFELKKEETGG